MRETSDILFFQLESVGEMKTGNQLYPMHTARDRLRWSSQRQTNDTF